MDTLKEAIPLPFRILLVGLALGVDGGVAGTLVVQRIESEPGVKSLSPQVAAMISSLGKQGAEQLDYTSFCILVPNEITLAQQFHRAADEQTLRRFQDSLCVALPKIVSAHVQQGIAQVNNPFASAVRGLVTTTAANEGPDPDSSDKVGVQTRPSS
jgi:hypothetical protein